MAKFRCLLCGDEVEVEEVTEDVVYQHWADEHKDELFYLDYFEGYGETWVIIEERDGRE